MKRLYFTFLFLFCTNAIFANLHIVTNSNDAGPGSLRTQIANAIDGDTITFHNSIQGQTILLTSGEISFSKALVILGGGVGNTIIDGNHNSRIFNASNASKLVISDLTIKNGFSNGHGGGLICENIEELILNRTHINNNEALSSGGGIYTFSFAFSIEVQVNKCTLFDNVSALNGGAIGISNPNHSVYATIINSTLTGNSADQGGGIYAESTSSASASEVTIVNSTIVNNIALSNGGGIFSNSGSVGTSVVDITSSIIAFNGTSNIYSNPSYQITSGGYNIFDNSSLSGTVSSDQMGAIISSVNLDTLNFNGGPTLTMRPLCGSIAIDMGNPTDNTDTQNYFVTGTSREVGAAESVSITETSEFDCTTFTVPSGNETYTSFGNYTVYDTIPSSCGTDSLLIINLSIGINTTDTVMNSNDSGLGSLRQIINNACSGDTVVFDSSLDGTPIVLTSGHIALNKDITIIGNGINNTIIDGNGTSRIFYLFNQGNASIDNMSIQNGYAFGSNGAGIAVDDATLQLDNVQITDCDAVDYTLAGALYLGNAEATINNCIFSGNHAGGSGGAIYQIYGGSLLITNTLISGNVTDQNGGGIYAPTPSNIDLTNVTITGNYAENSFGGIMDDFTAYNSIIWGNHAVNSIPEAGLSNSTLNYSIVKDEVGINGVGNIDGTSANSPLFIQPIIPDTIPNIGGDFHLGEFSTLIDAGLNSYNNTSYDLAGMSRIEDGNGNGTSTIDLGAYEYFSTLNVNQIQSNNISIYPNPVTDELTVTNHSNLLKVDIYNTMGQLVKSTSYTSGEVKINVVDLETGIYLVKLISEEGILSTRKIFKK